MESTTSSRDDEVAAVDLLDEYWFFENLFRKPNMLRSSSDPYPSSNNMDDTFEQIQRSNQASDSINVPKQRNLHRTPSLPPSIGRGEEEESIRRTTKLNRHASLCSSNILEEEAQFVRRTNKLNRQTSLCSSKESLRTSSKLNRQNSLGPSTVLPPLQVSKMITASPGIPKHQARRESKMDTTATKDKKKSTLLTKEVISRSLNQVGSKSLGHNLSSKSLSELEGEEVQGFKDLGFVFDKQVLNPSVLNIIPGLRSKNPDDHDDDNKARRPYLSEAWLAQRYSPPIPHWIGGGDVKAQLKFWARTVASNVHQEC